MEIIRLAASNKRARPQRVAPRPWRWPSSRHHRLPTTANPCRSLCPIVRFLLPQVLSSVDAHCTAARSSHPVLRHSEPFGIWRQITIHLLPRRYTITTLAPRRSDQEAQPFVYTKIGVGRQGSRSTSSEDLKTHNIWKGSEEAVAHTHNQPP